jgi:hypothetical protein
VHITQHDRAVAVFAVGQLVNAWLRLSKSLSGLDVLGWVAWACSTILPGRGPGAAGGLLGLRRLDFRDDHSFR